MDVLLSNVAYDIDIGDGHSASMCIYDCSNEWIIFV